MAEDDFDVAVSAREDGAVLTLSGTVNRGAKEKLEAAYRETGNTGQRVLLDFGRVDYINSTGIAVIVGLLAMARAEGRAVAAFGLSDHYRTVFEITRLSDFMNMYENEAAAFVAGS